MKLVTFSIDETSHSRVGSLIDHQTKVVDLQSACESKPECFDSMIELISRGDEGIEMARKAQQRSAHVPSAIRNLEEVRLHSPVPIPNSIRDCMEFEQHLVQSTRTVVRRRFRPLFWLDSFFDRVLRRPILRVPSVWHERPLYYKGNRRTVVGTDCDVRWPGYTEQLDFELEFGVFIGQGGTNISVSEAPRHIAGYALFNDFSARDIQLREMQGRLGPAKGKDFETGNAIGPWLTTPDEVDSRQLSLEVRVNDELWSKSTSADMKFSFAQIINYVSQDETLYPGDFIGSGTLPGGCGLELDRWIQPGDVVELSCSALGALRNRVLRNP